MISWLTYHSLLYVVHLTMCSLCVRSELTEAFFGQANYFAMGCLQFTTVGSTTILTSTSGKDSPV